MPLDNLYRTVRTAITENYHEHSFAKNRQFVYTTIFKQQLFIAPLYFFQSYKIQLIGVKNLYYGESVYLKIQPVSFYTMQFYLTCLSQCHYTQCTSIFPFNNRLQIISRYYTYVHKNICAIATDNS